ncbi:ATP-binding protein [Lutimaribacter marinistellae]|uniref:ATP-binding protein n=1 Tax=Lutimaribacter marinistellae TaxID=1820329 RepID=A0ABV7TC46_9RHOB
MPTPPETESFALSFQASEGAARDGIRAVASALRWRGLSGDRAGDVELALAEAINNVVEHAYAGLAPGQVHVTCWLGGGRLDILISDNGHAMPGGRLPEGTAAKLENAIEDLPEGGFGWFLIRQLATEIRYERCSGLNRLSLMFDLPRGRGNGTELRDKGG